MPSSYSRGIVAQHNAAIRTKTEKSDLSGFFYHPDFTVGAGISPVQSRVSGSRGL